MKYKEELKNWEKKMQSVGLLPVVKQLKTITRSGDAHDLALVSDMPQYPLRAFQLFMTDFLKTYSGAEPAKSVALREWKEMSFIKQEKYRRAAAADMQVYIKAMEEWKDKMMQSGHGDVLAKLSPMLSSLQTGGTAIEDAQTSTLFAMPERPRTEFWRFYDEFSRTYSGRQPTKIAAIIAWRTVSEEERERYSSAYQAELKVYSEKVNEWMEKMLSNENYSILKRYIGKPDVKNVAEEYFTRKYEIPQRPKLSPYLRFREDFKQTHSLSDDSKRDARLIARAWRNLPDESKAKYISSWNEEMQLYRESLTAWKEKMRSSEREDILKQLEALRLFALKPMRPAAVRGERGQLESSTQQNRKSEAACLVVEYEMPKRPQHSAYLEFFHEFAKSYTGDESQAKAAGRAWKELTDAEKEKYNSKCSEKQQAYKEQMKEWMDKMISNGNEEILLKLKVTNEPDMEG
uniref:HMG box domain-containing protein n=1 Tax=Plectus sambesii TaxID=2011161 RepID=A0A914WBD5_9BILA